MRIKEIVDKLNTLASEINGKFEGFIQSVSLLNNEMMKYKTN